MTQGRHDRPKLRHEDGDAALVREEYELLCRLKLLRSQGRTQEARALAESLELHDRADDWAHRYGS